MSTGMLVLNWNELIEALQDKINIMIDGDISVDFSNLSSLFEKYFPDIIELLKAIMNNNKRPEGIQKAKGLHQKVMGSSSYTLRYTPREDVLMTGITYSQSLFTCDDTFDLKIVSPQGKELLLMDGVYVKDGMQHKLFQCFLPIPQGYEIKLDIHNNSGNAKDVWVDFEYLGVKKLSPDEGTLTIRYLGRGIDDYVLLNQENQQLPLGIHTIVNNKQFDGYKAQAPQTKMITLSEQEPIRILEFYYEDLEDITHPYDVKITLRWENNSCVDLDLHAFVNHKENEKVGYNRKEFFVSEDDKLWLDYDYTAHDETGYDKQPEVITALGFKNSTLSVQINNFGSRELTQDIQVTVEARGRNLRTYNISKDYFNQGSTRAYYVCDINLNQFIVSDKLKVIEKVGVFS